MDEKKIDTTTVKMAETEVLRVMLLASQVREAESQVQVAQAALQLRKAEQQMLANSIAVKYSEGGKYTIVGMDLEKGVERALTTSEPVAETARPRGPKNPPRPPNPPEAG